MIRGPDENSQTVFAVKGEDATHSPTVEAWATEWQPWAWTSQPCLVWPLGYFLKFGISSPTFCFHCNFNEILKLQNGIRAYQCHPNR